MLKRYLGIFLAAFACHSTAFAMNGLNTIGVGVKSKGMGGVGVALPQDSFASAFNPAGMSYLCNRFDVGFSWTWQSGLSDFLVDITGPVRLPFGPLQQQVSAYLNHSDPGLWYPEIGMTWAFCPCQVFGLAIYMNGGFHTDYDRALPFGVVAPSLECEYRQLFVTPSWSWQINCTHSVGVAVNVAISWFNLEGFQAIPFSQLSLFNNDVTDRGTDFQEGVSVRFGWLGNFCNRLKFGATFQTKTWTSRFKKYQGFLVDGGKADLAPEVGLGFSWNCWRCFTIAGDFVYRIWSSSKEFDYNHSQPGTPFTNFGGDPASGLGWNDSPVVKIGAAWQPFPCLTLRVGYNYGEQPIAPSETLLNQIDLQVIQNHITAGVTWVVCCCHELSAYYCHGFENTVRGFNSFDQPGLEIDLTNVQNSFGVSYGRRF